MYVTCLNLLSIITTIFDDKRTWACIILCKSSPSFGKLGSYSKTQFRIENNFTTCNATQVSMCITYAYLFNQNS
jgi:hypothetical protein